MKFYDVSKEFQGGYTLKRTSTQAIVVHHAGADYAGLAGLDDVRAVAKFHTDPAPRGRGWPGLAYHLCLAEETNDGPIAAYICGDLDGQRAHVLNRNHELLGVCCLTNFDDKDRYPDGKPTQKWIDALAEAILWLKPRYEQAIVLGHQEAAVRGGETACPGSNWPKWRVMLMEKLINPAPAVVEAFAQPRVYRVVDPTGANVRTAPDTRYQSNIVGAIPAGDPVAALAIVKGSAYKGSTDWLQLGAQRFAHSKLFEPIALPPTQQPDADHVLVRKADLAAHQAKINEANEHQRLANEAYSVATFQAHLFGKAPES